MMLGNDVICNTNGIWCEIAERIHKKLLADLGTLHSKFRPAENKLANEQKTIEIKKYCFIIKMNSGKKKY